MTGNFAAEKEGPQGKHTNWPSLGKTADELGGGGLEVELDGEEERVGEAKEEVEEICCEGGGAGGR